MNDYTVLLLYPDYLGAAYRRGFATFMGHGSGTPAEAIARVRQQAADINNHDHDDDDFAKPLDFAVLAVFEGKHHDVNPELRIFEVDVARHADNGDRRTLRFELLARELEYVDVDDLLASPQGLVWDEVSVEDYYADDIRELTKEK